MIKLIKKISEAKEDVVFVGSVSLWNSNLISHPHDIDIVVNNIDGLETFGKIETWESKSPMSISGKRACIKREDYTIDIFIEDFLPEFTIKDGIKFQTVNNLKAFLDLVIESSEGVLKNVILEKKKKYNFN
jgi:hypothetical protein